MIKKYNLFQKNVYSYIALGLLFILNQYDTLYTNIYNNNPKFSAFVSLIMLI